MFSYWREQQVSQENSCLHDTLYCGLLFYFNFPVAVILLYFFQDPTSEFYKAFNQVLLRSRSTDLPQVLRIQPARLQGPAHLPLRRRLVGGTEDIV